MGRNEREMKERIEKLGEWKHLIEKVAGEREATIKCRGNGKKGGVSQGGLPRKWQ